MLKLLNKIEIKNIIQVYTHNLDLPISYIKYIFFSDFLFLVCNFLFINLAVK